jgi:hypothetical protein
MQTFFDAVSRHTFAPCELRDHAPFVGVIEQPQVTAKHIPENRIIEPRNV